MNTPLVKRAYNLGLKAVPNFMDALNEEQIAYYEQHLDELPMAIRRGFILPSQPSVISTLAMMFKTSETDLDWWLDMAEKFAKQQFGINVILRELFDIPTELPWKSVIPVFCPAGVNNREMIEKVLKSLERPLYEETDVMKYSGSEASDKPTLHFIENSIRPNADTMNMSPNQLRETGKSYLRLRGYGLAFGLYHFAMDKYLDKETWTWFPEDRLSDGRVAGGSWYPDFRKVRFGWGLSDGRNALCGARVAMPVSLKL